MAFTVWGDAERCEATGIALAALGLGGRDDAPQPPLPFGQPLTHDRAALEEAGFLQPIARHLDIGWRVRGAAPIIDGFERYAGLAQLVTEEQRAAFAAAIDKAVSSRAQPDGTTYLPKSAILNAGRKPC